MPEIPTGTVTFLFTDLEGSTRLWEEHPDAMQAALARHDEILRDAVESHGGLVVKTTGDGVHAAFADAADAVVAAVEAQRQLAEADWPLPEPLRVRMGIHTGAAEHRGGDYYGPAVNRAARLMSAANGGQILVSLATEEVLSEALPPGVELLDLGEHRLRDLARSQRIFQVVAPDLTEKLPPIRSLDAFPGNLPSQLTSFVGRADDLVGVANALEQSRMVTLTGAGGMGKTRLAIQVAAELLTRFPDGAWLCELAPASDGEALVQAVAGALGAPARHAISVADSIVEFLRPKRLLLILDNCEQVLADAANLAGAVLQGCPQVRILATSRTALDVRGEQQWAVRSLELPGAETTPEALEAYDAVHLFLDRARATRRDFQVDEGNAAAIAEICRRLDGMPLALELAAARVSALGPVEIASLLGERFRLLTGGGRDERHHTLRAAIDWSYSLLDDTPCQVFDRAGVFVGSFDADAARSVISGDGIDHFAVIDALTHLVEQSMIIAEPAPDGTMRYELLETLRQYAIERLSDRDIESWRRRHAEHFARIAERAGAGLMTEQELVWKARLALDSDNFQAAVSWATDSRIDSDAAIAARIVAHLSSTVSTNPRALVGSWAERLVARDAFPDAPTRCSVFGAAALTAVGSGRYGRACELARAGLRDGLPRGTPTPNMGYNALACATAVFGAFDDSMLLFEEGVRALDSIGAPAGDYLILQGAAAMVEAAYGRHGSARARAEQLLPLARATGYPSGLVGVLVAFAWSTIDDDPDVALAALEEAVELGYAGAQQASLGIALSMMAQLRCRRGEPRAAIAAVRATVVINADNGQNGMLITALQRSLSVLVDVGQTEVAAVLGGALSDRLGRLGHLPPNERVELDAALAGARHALGADAYESLTSTGVLMTLDELIMFARTELDRILEELGDG